MRYVVGIDGEEILVDVEPTSDGRFKASIVGQAGPDAGETWRALPGSDAHSLTLVAGSRVIDLRISQGEDGLDVHAAGERFGATIGPARAAVQICADIEFPEINRLLALRGVELVLCPSLTWNTRGAHRFSAATSSL